MLILGISAFYHDSAACIVKDGKLVVAVAEERLSRKKHDNSFPHNAIDHCLKHIGVAANEIDLIVFYEKPLLKFERLLTQHVDNFPKSLGVYAESMGSWFNEKLQLRKILRDSLNYYGKLSFVPHHLSHASSAYYPSGYKKAAILTIDGVGEWATTTMGCGNEGIIKIDKEIKFPHSLGLLYSTITSYLGFKVNSDEYKVMGLAAYGDPKPFLKKVRDLVNIHKDGSYSLNMKYFDYCFSGRMFSGKLEKHFGYKKRLPESKIESHHENIAAALQQVLEEVVFGMLDAVYRKYKTKNICLSGGVALNSVMNGKILKRTRFKNVFIPPDPGDAGGCVGAALYMHRVLTGKSPDIVTTPYLGPEYSTGQIKKTIESKKLKYNFYPKTQKLLEVASSLLLRKKVVGWFQGRMEWGPRALGSRSILADASDVLMRDIINAKVKKREMFRPFAPVILNENVRRFFSNYEDGVKSLGKYMLVVLPFKDEGLKSVPATVHVDGTGRLQLLERRDNPLYYDLIKMYQKKSGRPAIINTSFNVRGEPIVCTPEDAVNCFLSTGIDALIIGNYVIKK